MTAESLRDDRGRLLHELGRAFASRIELDELLPLVLAECCRALDAESASVLLLDRERGELYFPYVAQDDPRAAAELRALRIPADRGVAGATLAGGRSLRIDDVASDSRFYTGVDRKTGLTTRAMLSAPLGGRGGPIGVVQVLNPRGGGVFTDADLSFLDALAGSVAVAIENAQLYAELKRFAAGLEQQVAERTAELQEKNGALERALDELREAQERMVVQEKLAALGALTAGVAHEIKNPLNFVNNFADLSGGLGEEIAEVLAAERDRLDPDALADIEAALGDLRSNLERISEHGRRADRVVDSMLQHARPSSGDRRPTDLNALLAETIALAQHTGSTRCPGLQVKFSTDFDPAASSIPAVAQDLQRVFLNILLNALDALRDKQKKLGESFAAAIAVKTKAHPAEVEIRLRDNGPGMPPDVRAKIFEPFFTTKPTGEGTGLGLSISHDIIVGQHRGTLRVESEEGEYTEFVIALPGK
jgi:signal transduction histidine kinase